MFILKLLLEGRLKKIWRAAHYRGYKRMRSKSLSTSLRISCLEKCLENDLIQKFLTSRIPNNGAFEPTTVKNFQRRFLRYEINNTRSLLKQHTLNLDSKRNELKSNVP